MHDHLVIRIKLLKKYASPFSTLFIYQYILCQLISFEEKKGEWHAICVCHTHKYVYMYTPLILRKHIYENYICI